MSETYKFPLLEKESGKVICQICGENFVMLSPSHLKTHGVKMNEYKFRYPDAPISASSFSSATKEKMKDSIFVKKELEEIENIHDDKEEFFDNEPIIDEHLFSSEFKPLDEKDIKIKKSLNICDNMKEKILDILRSFLTNVKKDYIIIEYTLTGKIITRTITDFADPILKINVEFPKTFWHNKDQFIDPIRNKKLKECGWKVIEINSLSPTYKEIEVHFK